MVQEVTRSQILLNKKAASTWRAVLLTGEAPLDSRRANSNAGASFSPPPALPFQQGNMAVPDWACHHPPMELPSAGLLSCSLNNQLRIFSQSPTSYVLSNNCSRLLRWGLYHSPHKKAAWFLLFFFLLALLCSSSNPL